MMIVISFWRKKYEETHRTAAEHHPAAERSPSDRLQQADGGPDLFLRAGHHSASQRGDCGGQGLQLDGLRGRRPDSGENQWCLISRTQ